MRLFVSTLAVVAAVTLAPAAEASPKGCPPGLAKKSVPCVPPGQAKSRFEYSDHAHGDHVHPYRPGDIVNDVYVVIRNPGRYGLDPRGTYYQSRGYVVRVDEATREVLDLIGAVSRILN